MINRGGINKKGQVTIFIIVGLIIIASTAGFFVVKSTLEKRALEREQEQVILLPEKIRPVKEAIDSCIKEISEDALQIIGMQGGYLILPEDKYITNPNNEFSNHLTIFSDLRVPYWYYQNTAETEVQEIPTIDLIKSQIEDYITTNIPVCIPEAQQISRTGYTLEVQNPQTKVEIKKNEDINIKIQYPMIFKVNEDTFNFNNFNQELDLDFYNIYEAATKITQSEINTNFLEEQTIDMMVIYDQIPYDFIELSCTPKLWSITDVIKDFKNILSTNIPIIKIKNTDYQLKEDSRNIFVWDAFTNNFEHLNINLVYSQNWPFKLEVNPNDNGILKGRNIGRRLESQQLGIPLGLVCLHEYHFVYDIKYPVLLTINDPNAFDGEGYIFQYAVQVVIDNNQPRKNEFRPLFQQEDKTFCSRPGYETRIVSLTKDQNNIINLEDTEISYKCSTTTCSLGKTIIDNTGEASLIANIPPCINGLLIAQKSGYNPGEITFSSNEPGVASLVLEKYYDQNIEIKVIDPQKGIRDLFESEQVIINLESPEYTTSYLSKSQDPLKLIPGNYKLETTIIRDSKEGIIIPGFTQERCTTIPKIGIAGLFGLEEERCVDITIEDTILDQVVVGGANTNIQISELDLIQNNKLIIYTYYNGIPSSLDELNSIQSEIETNSQKAGFISPRFE